MGTLTVVGRIVLVAINLLSVILIVAGFVLRFAKGWLRPKVNDVLDKIVTEVQTAYGNTNFNMDDFDLGSLIATLCYVMIGTGVVLLAIALLGCLGACCSFKKLMLVVYYTFFAHYGTPVQRQNVIVLVTR